MGVDFFSCDGCGESICDCGSYIKCRKCEHRWCDLTCAIKNGGYKYNDDEDDDDYDDDYEEQSCKFCRKEEAEDSDLLNFLIKKYKLNRKTVVQLYFESKDKKRKKKK